MINGAKHSAEVRARLSEARKRTCADPEVRARMSEATKRSWADPEVRARRSEASKRAFADPEFRARRSEARKRGWAKQVVTAADLPLLRWLIDRARALLDGGASVEESTNILRYKYGSAA